MDTLSTQDTNAGGSEPGHQEDLMSEMPEMTAEEQLAMLQLEETIMRKQERILSEQLYKLKIEEVTLRRIIDNQNRRGYNATQEAPTAPVQRSQEAPIEGGEISLTEEAESSQFMLSTEQSQRDFLYGSGMLGSQPPPPPLSPSQLASQRMPQSAGTSSQLPSLGSQTLYDSLYF